MTRTVHDREKDQWRWYHHLALVAWVAAFVAAWSWLRPSDLVTWIGFAVCVVGFVVSAALVRRRQR